MCNILLDCQIDLHTSLMFGTCIYSERRNSVSKLGELDDVHCYRRGAQTTFQATKSWRCTQRVLVAYVKRSLRFRVKSPQTRKLKYSIRRQNAKMLPVVTDDLQTPVPQAVGYILEPLLRPVRERSHTFNNQHTTICAFLQHHQISF